MQIAVEVDGIATMSDDPLAIARFLVEAITHGVGRIIKSKQTAVHQARGLWSKNARVTQLAKVLLEKDPVALKATKDAIRRVKEMTYDNAEDYLVRAQEAAYHFDRDASREGIRQFIDEKSYKPGLGAFDKKKRTKKSGGEPGGRP